jgi:hypothetical protein
MDGQGRGERQAHRSHTASSIRPYPTGDTRGTQEFGPASDNVMARNNWTRNKHRFSQFAFGNTGLASHKNELLLISQLWLYQSEYNNRQQQ